MRVWLCHGRSGVLRDRSSSRCEARSHPFATPSCSYPLSPEKKISLPVESSFRTTTNRSRSSPSEVLIHSFNVICQSVQRPARIEERKLLCCFDSLADTAPGLRKQPVLFAGYQYSRRDTVGLVVLMTATNSARPEHPVYRRTSEFPCAPSRL